MDSSTKLSLYTQYSRKDVHDIFSPDTRFTSNSGTWGLHGIIELHDPPGDFIFFVTFGQQQAEHVFDEWITEDGVFSWQSQPRQNLKDRKIQQFIHHDENENSIYLFLRTQRNTDYTYLGRLKYLEHDPDRENPVYIYWQLLDWPIPETVISHMQLILQPANIFQAKPGIDQHKLSGTIERENHQMTHDRFKPKNRTVFFQNIARLMSENFPQVMRGAVYRFPDPENWFEIRFPDMSGYYGLRLANKFDEYAFFFPGNREKTDRIVGELTPHLLSLNKQLNENVTAISQYWKTWGRLGYETPGDEMTWTLSIYNGLFQEESEISTDQEVTWDSPNEAVRAILGCQSPKDFHDKFQNKELSDETVIEAEYAWNLVGFIRATHEILFGIIGHSTTSLPLKKPSSPELVRSHDHILENKINDIQHVLAGSSTTPLDEVLCDWVHFCYEFGFYKEGELLFSLVASEQVNPWYYERTKKLARLCSMKASAKDTYDPS